MGETFREMRQHQKKIKSDELDKELNKFLHEVVNFRNKALEQLFLTEDICLPLGNKLDEGLI